MQGRFVYPDGSTYIGQQVFFVCYGLGYLSLADGTKVFGLFKNNILIEGIIDEVDAFNVPFVMDEMT